MENNHDSQHGGHQDQPVGFFRPVPGPAPPRAPYCDHTLDDNMRAPQRQLTSSSGLMVPQAPSVDLGMLSRLPIELLGDILPQLDVRSLTNFQYVNKQAFEIVQSLPTFKAVFQHAPNALAGILAIDTGNLITLNTLFEKLCTYKCETCERFGGYLYILTCKRVCYFCFIGKEEYMPLLPLQARRKYGLTRAIADTLPSMKTVEGRYAVYARPMKKDRVLVDPHAAREAGLALHGSAVMMRNFVGLTYARQLRAFYARRHAAFQNWVSNGGARPDVRRPPRPHPRDAWAANPARFVAIVRVPFLNREARQAEWGPEVL